MKPNNQAQAHARVDAESGYSVDHLEVDQEHAQLKRHRRRAFRAFTTFALFALGGLLLILLVCGTILDLGVFSSFRNMEPVIDKLVHGLFISSVGFLCVTLGLERKVDFDNIDTTLERINALIKHDNEQRDKQAVELIAQCNNISTSLQFIDDNFVSRDNSFDMFWGISLLKARARQELIRPDTFVVNKSNVPRFWIQMISNTDSSWSCTDRVEHVTGESSSQFWSRRLSKRGLETQGCLVKDFGVNVRRVFIFDKKEDAQIPLMKKMMEDQSSLGIGVGWVSLECILENVSLKVFQGKLHTVDFTIINNRYLFSYKMANRIVDSIECTSNQQLVSFVRDQYDLLFAESNRLS